MVYLLQQVLNGLHVGALYALLAFGGAGAIPFIAIFFAAMGVGSTRLELNMQLDSALGGVIEASVVLAVLLVGGWRALLAQRRRSEVQA